MRLIFLIGFLALLAISRNASAVEYGYGGMAASPPLMMPPVIPMNPVPEIPAIMQPPVVPIVMNPTPPVFVSGGSGGNIAVNPPVVIPPILPPVINPPPVTFGGYGGSSGFGGSIGGAGGYGGFGGSGGNFDDDFEEADDLSGPWTGGPVDKDGCPVFDPNDAYEVVPGLNNTSSMNDLFKGFFIGEAYAQQALPIQIRALLEGRRLRAPRNITFGFGHNTTENFRNAVRSAMASWEAVANVQFVAFGLAIAPCQGYINIFFDIVPQNDPNIPPGMGGVNIPATPNSHRILLPQNGDSYAKGNYPYMSIIHEIGHALGLKHPGDYPAGANTPGPFLAPSEDNRRTSLMSYENEEPIVNRDQELRLPSTPQVYDIAAMQFLYGVNPNYNPTDDYRFTTSDTMLLPGGYFNYKTDEIIPGPVRNARGRGVTIYDKGGYNSISTSALRAIIRMPDADDDLRVRAKKYSMFGDVAVWIAEQTRISSISTASDNGLVGAFVFTANTSGMNPSGTLVDSGGADVILLKGGNDIIHVSGEGSEVMVTGPGNITIRATSRGGRIVPIPLGSVRKISFGSASSGNHAISGLNVNGQIFISTEWGGGAGIPTLQTVVNGNSAVITVTKNGQQMTINVNDIVQGLDIAAAVRLSAQVDTWIIDQNRVSGS